MYVRWFICEAYICYPSQMDDSTDTTALAIPLCRYGRDFHPKLNYLDNSNRNAIGSLSRNYFLYNLRR